MGSAASSQDLLKLEFDYGTTDNNGNVKSQTITVPTIGVTQGFTAVQNYTYDSLNRIKSAVETSGTSQNWKQTFVYDASGRSIADYSTIVESAENAKVAYLTADHLGSPRINTDNSSNVISRHDYMPYGEEIYTSQRTIGLAYDADTIRKQFTSYERDNETNLDYAKARYFNSGFGRFSSPDPYNIIFEKEKAKVAYEEREILNSFLSKPQKWNRYVYVLNNPLKFTDPTGLSEQGGTAIKHPDKRRITVSGDEILTVNIETRPANPVNGTGISGQDVFRYDTEVTVTNENGEVVPSESTLYFFDARGNRRENVNTNNEPIPLVETVDVDNEGESEPEPRSATVEVKGEKKDIDYKIQEVGNTVQVVQGSYDNKIVIPGVPKSIDVPVSGNKPDPIVESMRPKRRGTTFVINGY